MTTGTVRRATPHTVAAEYSRSILRGTPNRCSSRSGTALCETYIAGQEESVFAPSMF